jgi:hypothetical protein
MDNFVRGVPGSSDYSPDHWPEFSFPEDGFKIKMPGEPEKVIVASPYAGKKVPMTLFRYFGKTSMINHAVSYAQFTYNLESPRIVNQLFDEMRERLVNRADSVTTYNIISETDLIFENNPGRLLQVEVDHQYILRAKSLAFGNRLYQVMVITMSLGGISKEMRNLHEKIAFSFLDSFELLKTKERHLFIE